MIGAILSPPNIGYDAGNGVLDLLNFKDGGQFQHHSGPAINQESDCREGRTTWWSPGQWFFAYMINLLGVPLGYSYSLLAVLCIGFGVFGWTKVFQKFSVKPEVIYLAACIMLFSRFNYSQVMIFSGASVLEFGLAPWIFLLWFWFKRKASFIASCLIDWYYHSWVFRKVKSFDSNLGLDFAFCVHGF